MKAFCFSLAILCVVQTVLAIPRPDFGINANVGNSANVITAANLLSTEFAKAGAYDVTLTSGYGLLTTLKTKLEAIGDTIASTGSALATQLGAFATDKTNAIASAFGAVSSQVTALESYINNPITNVLDIQTLLGNDYIKAQFDDAFTTMETTIVALKLALSALQTAVNNARSAAGSSATVAPATIKKYIAGNLVTDVITQIRYLRANIPVITYIINSSLDNLLIADEFVRDIHGEALSAVNDYATEISTFKTNLTDEITALSAIPATVVKADVTTLLSDIQNDLNSNIAYTSSGLPVDLSGLNDAITSGLNSVVIAMSSSFATYSSAFPNLISDLNIALGNNVCESIQVVSEALVSNGPYSDFCFSKYSPQVFALLGLTINAFDACFQFEVNRLGALDAIVTGIIEQIYYNVVDVHDNLSTCLHAPNLSAQQMCFGKIQPYYNELVAQVGRHETTIESLVDKETVASLNRLGACIATSLYVTVIEAENIDSDVGTCMTNGP